MFNAFLPDYIIGSNVAYNAPEPSADDLMSQLKAIMTQPTNYVLPCDPGIIIEPKTSTTIFDFASAKQAVLDGYASAMERMPEIKVEVKKRRAKAEWNRHVPGSKPSAPRGSLATSSSRS
ncbi:MAG: hypothetical protein IPL81_04810 [Flavobacteriales bacterium]|nr:hypothetical protein [Flavobacteriales bacterium]